MAPDRRADSTIREYVGHGRKDAGNQFPVPGSKFFVLRSSPFVETNIRTIKPIYADNSGVAAKRERV